MKLDRRLFLLLPLAWFALGVLQESRPASLGNEPVTVILVRHAEKAKDDPRDPSLSEAGLARAVALADLVGNAGVTHLFASEFIRTQATLAPLSKVSHLAVEVVSARSQEKLLKRLHALKAGSVAVVAGHSNTVPSIARALGAKLSNLVETERSAMLGDDEYDRLFLLTLPAAGTKGVATKTIELRY